LTFLTLGKFLEAIECFAGRGIRRLPAGSGRLFEKRANACPIVQPICNLVYDYGSDESYLRVAEFVGILLLPESEGGLWNGRKN
jgi:hypothetical protein